MSVPSTPSRQRINLLPILLAPLFAMSAAQAADVVVQPSAGSALVVKDNTGAIERLRVSETGLILVPGWPALPQQISQMCINSGTGSLGPCAATVGFNLPYAATVNSPSTLFDITQTGAGGTLSAAISNAGSSATAMTVTTAGLGNGMDVQLPTGSGGRGINVTSGVGPGVFVTSAGGNSIWGIVNSISAAAVIGDGGSGEVIVARHTGVVCSANIGRCAGIGAVVGRHDGERGIAVRGFVTDPNGGTGVLGQAGISGGSGVAGRFENVNGASPTTTLEVESNGNGDLMTLAKSGANVARIDSTGKGFFNGGTQTGGADVAELIDFRGRIPRPGDVVEIDPENSLHYRLSTGSESALVAGVITTKPGLLMNATVEDATGLPALALVGRVPVKVTLEGGDIKPGDLLVSASLPGHAKKAPIQIRPGTVIGKALQSYSSGTTGSVEMLVMTR
ncbi:hypothetical protein [Ottowia thiooxydans]|uniref:hypothetical protein n=1 Tax=Ottowia thiooxydans TaxID=219182 RepID=UPI000405B197|nr:hypothetical protein [Ottowia thiooxydans]